MFWKTDRKWGVWGWGLFFAVLLSLFSIWQKLILHADPLDPKGFVVPVLFGGGMGLALGTFIRHKRILTRQLSQRVEELEALNRKLSTLESFLPICMYCKRIRLPNAPAGEGKSWVQMESYIMAHTASSFSHGICPECEKNHHDEMFP